MQDFFEFSLGTRVLYKAGLACDLHGELAHLGVTRAFLVADQGVVSTGLLEPIIASLHEAVEVVGLFDEVPANSSVQMVMQGAAQAIESNADVLIAVGGGSPIDTAKCMRMVMTLGGHLLDYQGYNVLDQPLVPMVAIPTTAGTGSEVSPFAVIRDERQDLKLAFASPYLVPSLAVLDPELTCTLPARLTAATGLDALTHAIESFVSTDNNPFSDSMALYAIDIISSNLREATNDGRALDARGQMMIASCMAGIAFSNGFLGVVHALSHAVGGKFAVHHGTANAIFLPHGMRFNSVIVPNRFVRIARAMGVNAGGRPEAEVVADGIAAVQTLMEDCHIPTRLRDVGVPEDALPALAEIALTDAAIFNNPRSASTEDLLKLLQAAW